MITTGVQDEGRLQYEGTKHGLQSVIKDLIIISKWKKDS